MLVKNVALTLLKVQHKEGVGKKSGKEYSFYTATVVDEDANVFGFNLADEVVKAAPAGSLESTKNVSVFADVKFVPKGFDVSGQIEVLTPRA